MMEIAEYTARVNHLRVFWQESPLPTDRPAFSHQTLAFRSFPQLTLERLRFFTTPPHSTTLLFLRVSEEGGQSRCTNSPKLRTVSSSACILANACRFPRTEDNGSFSLSESESDAGGDGGRLCSRPWQWCDLASEREERVEHSGLEVNKSVSLGIASGDSGGVRVV